MKTRTGGAVIHTENRLRIDAPPATVFSLAAHIADWPTILPHYRYVRELRSSSPDERLQSRVVAMSARRSSIPVRWTSTQVIDLARREIRYHHIAGVTRGMDVVWRFDDKGPATEVTIVHDLVATRWWLRMPGISYIVGTLFVMHIADQTLRGVRSRAEAVASGTLG